MDMKPVGSSFQPVGTGQSVNPEAGIRETEKAISKKTSEMTKILNEISTEKSSFKGFFAWCVNFDSKPLKKITEFFCNKYPSIKEEIIFFNKKTVDLKIVQNEIKSLNDRLKYVKTTEGMSGGRVFQGMVDKRDYLENKKEIMSLFGGEEGYNELPEFTDTAEILGITKYIDQINPSQMKAPIMRGTDLFGRDFFTVRAKDSRTNEVHCQTFFRRETYLPSWSVAGKNIVDFQGDLFNGTEKNEDGFKDLKTLVDTKKLGEWRLE